MTKSSNPEKALLFLNNLAGDDLWLHGHLMLPTFQKLEIPQEFLLFKSEKAHVQVSDGLHLTSLPYELNGFGKVHLYGFPFLPFYVNPFDIQYHHPIQGLIVTEDMRMYDYFLEQNPKFINIADPHYSRLAWAQTQNVPCLLAVHHADNHKGDMEKLNRMVGMTVSCPVLWHTGEVTPDFLQKCVEALFTEIRQA